MKKTIFTAILSVATLHGYAQNVAGNFLPRANFLEKELLLGMQNF